MLEEKHNLFALVLNTYASIDTQNWRIREKQNLGGRDILRVVSWENKY